MSILVMNIKDKNEYDYSHVFDYVEIDSSFYRIPNVFIVNNWNTKTPKDFKFRI